ncbi:hypothetical protein ACLBOM_19915 [Escherichia coli]
MKAAGALTAQCGLTVEQLARQVEPEYAPARKVHFSLQPPGPAAGAHREDGDTAWRGEYDEWGNQLNEENPYYLHRHSSQPDVMRNQGCTITGTGTMTR